MSLETENPVSTILRLISSLIRVIKDDASVANILCTEANYDRELLKDRDAQITVSLDTSEDQKLNLAGTLRRRIINLKCVAVAVDRSLPGSDPGKIMRDKVQKQINAIIRENRTLPYQTTYNFYGLGYPAGDPHKAYDAAAATELAPSNASWAELSVTNYAKIWSSDSIWHTKSVTTLNQYPEMLLRFAIGPREASVKNIVLSFVGYGTAAAGNGITIKVYNHRTAAWESAAVGTGSSNQTITITLTSAWTDYIDADGYCWLLARTTNPGNGSTPAVLYCDFTQCVIQVQGLTYCDVVNFKEVDVVDVKPFLWKVEFILRGWLFETIV